MGRITARLLAPIAIAAVALGVYLIVHGNVATNSSNAAHTRAAHRHHRRHRSGHAAASGKPRFYTVRSGDTLSAIAGRTGVPLASLESLNPSLQPPYSLQTGQRLRLRR